MSKVDLRVDWCSHEAAKYAVEHWHYSHRMPHGKQQYIGAWECGQFIGAVIFGRSISPWIGNPYGLTQHQCAELTRVALAKHKSPVSRIVAVAIRLVKNQNPNLRLLVSYADPAQGHHGGIYQALGWVFDGNGSQRKQWLLDGKWRNDTHTWRLPKNFRDKLPTRITPEKYRYLMPLDDAMRAQITPLAKPYPKRDTSCVASKDSVAAGDQPAEGGANPTATL